MPAAEQVKPATSPSFVSPNAQIVRSNEQRPRLSLSDLEMETIMVRLLNILILRLNPYPTFYSLGEPALATAVLKMLPNLNKPVCF